MTSEEKKRIRCRDRKWANYHGLVPEGYEIHHKWYSEEFDRESFEIIKKEDHCDKHGRKYGGVYVGREREYRHEHYIEHKEDYLRRSREQREKNKSKDNTGRDDNTEMYGGERVFDML